VRPLRSPGSRGRLARLRREQQDQDIRRLPAARRLLWALVAVWAMVIAAVAVMIAADVGIPGRA